MPAPVIVRSEVPSVKVPAVMATLPLELIEELLARIVPVPFSVSPTVVIAAEARVTVPPFTVVSPLTVTVPAPVRV